MKFLVILIKAVASVSAVVMAWAAEVLIAKWPKFALKVWLNKAAYQVAVKVADITPRLGE